MTKTKLILVVTFALIFMAGGATGWMIGRRPRHPRSWLGAELHLTPEQREQMRSIWSSLPNPMREDERRRAVAKERDDALQALLTEEQKKAYQAICEDYDRKTAELFEARRKAFETAMARTQEILTPEQRERYERMRGFMRDRGEGPPRGRGWPRPGEGGRQPHPPGGPLPPPGPFFHAPDSPLHTGGGREP